ncbi:response regulator [Parafrankia sp. BMG5.11]|uniref:response regulator n=1 Tax=Parafrankia sp. BMG5.11 TaxID=222540 RepID=UPI00103C287B|nr:response regulator [Parafrankia sp. BMG5.11]TCJ39588.1 response regulator [Parafrankia sp. BMG5.11]
MTINMLRQVMLVEDDPDIASLIKLSLEEFGGLSVAHFASGRAALNAIGEISPNLVILDYRMPEMDGGEVIAELRGNESTQTIPVIFMTASVMPEHVERLRKMGAAAVIAKPFDPLTLPDQIAEIWSKLKP